MRLALNMSAATDPAFCSLTGEARARVILHVLRQCSANDVREATRAAPDIMLGAAGVICLEAAQ